MTTPPPFPPKRRRLKAASLIATLAALPVGTIGLALNSAGVVTIATLVFFGGFLTFAACRMLDEI